jgi:hypothetical protein
MKLTVQGRTAHAYTGGMQRACQLGCSVSTAEPAGSGPCSRGETAVHHRQRLQHPQRVPAWGATWNRPCAGGHHRRPARLLVVRWLARHPVSKDLGRPVPGCVCGGEQRRASRVADRPKAIRRANRVRGPVPGWAAQQHAQERPSYSRAREDRAAQRTPRSGAPQSQPGAGRPRSSRHCQPRETTTDRRGQGHEGDGQQPQLRCCRRVGAQELRQEGDEEDHALGVERGHRIGVEEQPPARRRRRRCVRRHRARPGP